MAGDIANVVESESKQERLQNIGLENLKKKKQHSHQEEQLNKCWQIFSQGTLQSYLLL